MECQICYLNDENSIWCDKCALIACASCLRLSIEFQLGEMSGLARCPNYNVSCVTSYSEKFIFDLFGSNWYKKTYLEKKFKNWAETLLARTGKGDYELIQKHFKEFVAVKGKVSRQKDELDDLFNNSGVNSELGTWFVKDFKKLGKEKAKAKLLFKQYHRNIEREFYLEKKITRSLSIDPDMLRKRDYAAAIVSYCEMKNCEGLILRPDHKCTMCSSVYCPGCSECLSGEEHVCDDTKKSDHSNFAKTTKFCPVCHTLCAKEGCDQVFCTNCKSLFDWETLELETGKIHNVEALNHAGLRGERDFDDIPCGGMPRASEFVMYFYGVEEVGSHFYSIFVSVNEAIKKVLQFASIRDGKVPELRKKWLMAEYALGYSGKKATAKTLIFLEKEHLASAKEMEIWRLYAHLGIERFRDLLANVQDLYGEEPMMFPLAIKDFLGKFFDEMNAVRLMINGQMQEQRVLTGQTLCSILDPYFSEYVTKDSSITVREDDFTEDEMDVKFNQDALYLPRDDIIL